MFIFVQQTKTDIMTYYRIFTEEQNGLCDTTLVKANKSIEKAKADYLEKRIIQSKKGFKRPIPLEITIQYGH